MMLDQQERKDRKGDSPLKRTLEAQRLCQIVRLEEFSGLDCNCNWIP